MAELYQLPTDLQQILSSNAKEGGEVTSRNLAAAIRRLSDLFLGKVEWDPDAHFDPKLRRAYIEYFLPVNLPKIRIPLGAWLTRRHESISGRPLRVLDLGCGPGTALLGLVDFFRSIPPEARPSRLELVGADASPEYLHHAARLLETFAATDPQIPPLRFEALRLDLFSDRVDLLRLATAQGRFDLVIGMNILCELDKSSDPLSGDRLVSALRDKAIHETGAIILIEPGLRDTSRALHALRDRQIAEGFLYAIAPCLHQSTCPALANAHDWCRADLAWKAPARVSELNRITGLRKESLKFSYLVLSPTRPQDPPSGAWRLVSDVRELKGDRRAYFCGNNRWLVVGQLKRVRGATATSFAELQRGDLVRLDGLKTCGTIFRVPADGRVERLPEYGSRSCPQPSPGTPKGAQFKVPENPPAHE